MTVKDQYRSNYTMQKRTSIASSAVCCSKSGLKVDSEGTVESVVIDAAVLGLSIGALGSVAGSVLEERADAVLD